ncbi:MAG: hypothetical protein JWN70_6641 [Planctomycetaceae bacterium]|nr:hypothetical protein [Planctomycetaceae bacterium]
MRPPARLRTGIHWRAQMDSFIHLDDGDREIPQELTSKNYPRMRPRIETMFYGARCVEVIDPFGNRLKFNERMAS